MARRTVYVLWTGENPMSEQRALCLAQLRDVCESDVVLITPENLEQHLVPGEPLHPAYAHLSLTHKADYLRTYLMHFRGGGYSDIKMTTGSWAPAFRALAASPDAWAVGYPEEKPGDVAGGPEVQRHWRELVGNGAYIFKPRTPLTQAWYRRMVALLDAKLPALRRHPAAGPRDCAEVSAYPIEWNEMLGRIFHPVCCAHRSRILRILPRSVFHSYR